MDPVVDPAFRDQAGMVEFVGKCRSVMERIEALGDVNAKMNAVDQLAREFRVGLDAIKASKAEESRIVPTGNDAELVRAYYNADATTSEGIADLRKGRAADHEKGMNSVGSSGGVVKLFGETDECGVFEYGLLDDPAPKTEWQRGLQRRLESLAMVRAIKGPRYNPAKFLRGIQKHIARGPSQIAKVFADNAGEGGEWIVSIPLTQLERTAEMIRLVEAALPDMQVTGGNTFTHPFLTTGVQPFIHGIPQTGDNNPAELTKTVPVTNERTITLKTLFVNVPVDMDAAEDAIVDAFGQFNDLVARALVDGTEDALINGDTAATHGDTAFNTWNPRGRWSLLGSTSDHRRGWIGFRQRAFDVSSTVDKSAAQGPANMLAFLATLTQPHGLGDVIGITSPEHYIAKILVDSNVLTVDKYGPSATLLTGEVARIGNRPLLLSEFVTADLAASGLYTGSGSTTSFMWINRSRFRMARRRNFRVNVENQYTRHTSFVVASERKTLHQFDNSTTKNVALAYNLSSS